MVDELAVTMRELGEGPWELTLEDGTTVEADLDVVEVTERGFHAEGHAEDGDLVELSTGMQPGGPVRLERRPSQAEDWETVGDVADATKLDRT
ncbi:MAG: hypothetical protein ABEH47_00455 [Haloferacaceae archaeon]